MPATTSHRSCVVLSLFFPLLFSGLFFFRFYRIECAPITQSQFLSFFIFYLGFSCAVYNKKTKKKNERGKFQLAR